MPNVNFSSNGKSLTKESVNELSQLRNKNDFQNLSEKQQIDIVTELTTIVFITKFKKMRENLPNIKQFIVDPSKFGAGFRIVMVDLLKITDFTKEHWWPENAVTPRDKEIMITETIKLNVRGDISQEAFIKYFRDEGDLANYINLQTDAAVDVLSVFYQQFIWNVFRKKEDERQWTVLGARDKDGKDDPEALKEWMAKVDGFVDLLQALFKNEKEVEYTVPANTKHDENYYKYKTMMKNIVNDVKFAVEKANLTNAIGQPEDPLHIQPEKGSLTIILNQKTKTDMNFDVRAITFDNELLNLPEIKVLEMSSFPDDEYMIIDDSAVQLSPVIREYNTFPKNIYSLWTLGNYVEWTRIGGNPYVYGIRAKMVNSSKVIPLEGILTKRELGVLNDNSDTTIKLGIKANNDVNIEDVEIKFITEFSANVIGVRSQSGNIPITFSIKTIEDSKLLKAIEKLTDSMQQFLSTKKE